MQNNMIRISIQIIVLSKTFPINNPSESKLVVDDPINSVNQLFGRRGNLNFFSSLNLLLCPYTL